MKKLVLTSPEQIIENHMWFSTASCFMPPILDIAAVTAVQVDMVKQLCELYSVQYDVQKGKSLSIAFISTLSGRAFGHSIGSSLKFIPIFGWIVGGISLATLTGASTYATGIVFKEHFERGGTLNDLNIHSFQAFYKKQFEKGKALLKRP